MRLSRRNLLLLGAAGAVGATGALARASAASAFPAAEFPLPDFGARPGVDCTTAISAAIRACHNAGGGHVVVPPGQWQSGAIRLRSNVNLRVESGATLAFNTDPAAYLPAVLTRWQGIECYNYSPLIYAFGERNIGISGAGVLDARGDNEHWWYWIGSGQYGWHSGLPNQRADWTALEQMGAAGTPVAQRKFGAGHYLRPSFIGPHSCTDVVIEGVTLRHSPMWNIHPIYCRNVLVQNVRIESLGPNGDGCDPDSCENVTIRDSYFATHDDCIAIKSGRDQDGWRVNKPSRRILVEGCTFVSSDGGAIAIGSEMSGGVTDVCGRNIALPLDPASRDPAVAYVLWLKSTATRGGYIANVAVTDVECTGRTFIPFNANFHYTGTGGGTAYPAVSDVRIARWRLGETHVPYDIEGVETAPIRNVLLDRCAFGVSDLQPTVEYVDGLRTTDVTIGEG